MKGYNFGQSMEKRRKDEVLNNEHMLKSKVNKSYPKLPLAIIGSKMISKRDT